MNTGAQVSFPALRGDREITLVGTLQPSRFRRWALVRLDDGRECEVRQSNLTAVDLDNRRNR